MHTEDERQALRRAANRERIARDAAIRAQQEAEAAGQRWREFKEAYYDGTLPKRTPHLEGKPDTWKKKKRLTTQHIQRYHRRVRRGS